MATEKRLIEELREVADQTPPICQYDTPHNVEIFGKEITVYCKPFEQFQELLRRAADALSVDAIEVSRLGKLGRLMRQYRGCGRGRMGPSFDSRIIELDPIEDVEGDRWVPVLKEDLDRLKAKAVEVVHGRWIKAECSEKDGNANCSICGRWYWNDCNYCPNCGADMRDGDGNVGNE